MLPKEAFNSSTFYEIAKSPKDGINSLKERNFERISKVYFRNKEGDSEKEEENVADNVDVVMLP